MKPANDALQLATIRLERATAEEARLRTSLAAPANVPLWWRPVSLPLLLAAGLVTLGALTAIASSTIATREPQRPSLPLSTVLPPESPEPAQVYVVDTGNGLFPEHARCTLTTLRKQTYEVRERPPRPGDTVDYQRDRFVCGDVDEQYDLVDRPGGMHFVTRDASFEAYFGADENKPILVYRRGGVTAKLVASDR